MAVALRRPKEFQEQIALFTWRDMMVSQEPRLAYLFAIPNGEERPSQLVRSRHTGQLRRVSRVGQKLKAMGLTPGIPDLCLAWPTREYHGFYGELKRAGLTAAQAWAACSCDEQRWLDRLAHAGYYTCVWSGWVQAARHLCAYLNVPHLQPET